MIEISKELLSELYNFDVKDFVKLGTDDVTCEVRFNGLKNGLKYKIVNIYELAHQGKEWAIELGYCLRSCIHDNGSNERFYSICEVLTPSYESCSLFDILHKTTEANTEIEAIFKACQWILDNKTNKEG